ncbi:hypothetical protein ACKU3Z_030120 [Pseudomonas aeruginosa]|nr:hypothetical protein [Pseudomonas aeruginosa]
MRNPIFHYSVIASHDGYSFDEGTSHAMQRKSGKTLCGVDYDDLDCPYGGSLIEYDGLVSCPSCMQVLKDRGVSMHPGPREFLHTQVEKNGVLLDSFGWGVFDQSYEQFFAYGHHAPGVVLDIARELSRNRLEGWEELQTTIYAHWSASLDVHEKDGPFCRLTWHKTADDADCYMPSVKVVPCAVTVIRHEAWPVLQTDDMESEHACRRLKAWYLGSTKLGRQATPDDLDTNYAPGYTVCGVPAGGEESTCLEWPTADFEEAMSLLGKWQAAGVTELKLVGQSHRVTLEELNAGGATIIRYGIQEHGRDFPFWDSLAMYRLAGS